MPEGEEKVASRKSNRSATSNLRNDKSNKPKDYQHFTQNLTNQSAEEYSELFFSAFNYAAIGMALVSLEGKWMTVNRSFCELTGYTEEELKAIDFQTITHPDDLEEDLEYVRRMLNKEIDTYQMEKRYIHKLGHIVWVILSVSLVNDSSGNPLYFIAQIQDITERKQLENSHHEIIAKLSKKNRYESIIRAVTQTVHRSIDLQKVIEDSVNSMSMHIEKADNVSIYMVEGKKAVIKSYRGYPESFIEKVSRIPYPKGFTWKTIIEGEVQYCADTDKDTAMGPAGHKIGTKSYLSMPIQKKNRTLGCININSLQKNAFDEEELKLLEIVAKQIEMAIGNARKAEELRTAKKRLEERVKQRTKELTKTNESLRIEISERTKTVKRLSIMSGISRILSYESRFERAAPKILRELFKVLDMEVGELWLPTTINSETLFCAEFKSSLKSKAARKFKKFTIKTTLGIDSFPGYSLKKRKPVWIPDLTKNPVFTRRQLAQELGLRSGLAFPIIVDGKPVGGMNFFTTKMAETSPDLYEMMTKLGHDIGQFLSRAKMVEELRESEARFRTMADSAPVMIWIAGTDKSCIWFNKEWLDFRGRNLEEEIVNGWVAGIHPDDRKPCIETYHTAFDKRESFEMEYRLQNAEGEYRWIVDRGIPKFSGDGMFRGYIGSCVDIHDRKITEELRRIKLTERENLLREVQHRIKNNLQMVMDMLDLQYEAIKSKKARDALRDTRSRIMSIARLHTRLRDEKKPDQIHLADHIEHLIQDLQKISGRKDDSVKFNLDIEDIKLDADTLVSVGFIINELVSNSLKHAFGQENKGIVSIKLSSSGKEKITLEVSDNGDGLPKGFNFKSTTTLGINIVRTFTQQLGGKLVRLNSRKGAGFKVTFKHSRGEFGHVQKYESSHI
ncbi:MAG: PAS domain S-box protein [Deltaproteobacteria bacterium]